MNFCYTLPNPLAGYPLGALSPGTPPGTLWVGYPVGGEGHRTGDEQTSAREPDMINEVKKGLR